MEQTYHFLRLLLVMHTNDNNHSAYRRAEQCELRGTRHTLRAQYWPKLMTRSQVWKAKSVCSTTLSRDYELSWRMLSAALCWHKSLLHCSRSKQQSCRLATQNICCFIKDRMNFPSLFQKLMNRAIVFGKKFVRLDELKADLTHLRSFEGSFMS